MKRKAYHLVFDGLSDWETPLALCAITDSGRLDVVTVGVSSEPVRTMGGLKVMPDITLKDIDAAEAGIFILPGGNSWEAGPNPEIETLLRQLHAEGVPLAAICGATLAIARAGLTRSRHHTSNGRSYLKAMLPEYGDEAFYVDTLAVTDGNVITASGLGGIEFGREVIKLLSLYSETDAQVWFDMHKHGIIPAGYQTAQ
jgi:putative intracellular protease/amidase